MYNLRSAKNNTVELPVEIQLTGDTTFLETVLKNNTTVSDIENSMSDSDISGSDLDCSGLMDGSDQVLSTPVTDKNSAGTSKTVTHVNSDKNSESDMQQLINARILDQLEKIGHRLDKIENKECKKSTDKAKIKNSDNKGARAKKGSIKVQHVSQKLHTSKPDQQSSVAEETLLQLKVDQRLQELSDMAKSGTFSKIKSQRGGPVEVMIKNRVTWPHEYVLSGLNKERVSYDQLNVTQWVAGFARTMRDESDPDLKQHMLDYLIALMDDANDFSWTSAKASHAVLLCRMEQGEVKNFSDTFAIDRIRRANAQKHVSNPQTLAPGISNSFKKSSKITRSMPCTYFNQGSCFQGKSHETKGVLYKHICASCFANSGKTFPHSEIDCKNKIKQNSKNE